MRIIVDDHNRCIVYVLISKRLHVLARDLLHCTLMHIGDRTMYDRLIREIGLEPMT